MYCLSSSPDFYLFHLWAAILNNFEIDGIKLTVRGHDRNETGYPVDCRAQTSLAFTQRLLRVHDFCHVAAGAAIAAKFSVGVKQGLAARPHVHRRAVTAHPAIYKVP